MPTIVILGGIASFYQMSFSVDNTNKLCLAIQKFYNRMLWFSYVPLMCYFLLVNNSFSISFIFQK